MVAADHDRRLQFAACHHLVEGEAQPMPVAEADPADPRRQALERNTLPRHVQPVVQVGVIRQQLLHLGIGAIDVFGIAGQRGPAERADAAAEQRTDVGGHEAREVERILDAFFQRHLADVVAVVDHGNAHAMEVEHGADVLGHRGARSGGDALGVGLAARVPFGDGPALRQITVDRIVR